MASEGDAAMEVEETQLMETQIDPEAPTQLLEDHHEEEDVDPEAPTQVNDDERGEDETQIDAEAPTQIEANDEEQEAETQIDPEAPTQLADDEQQAEEAKSEDEQGRPTSPAAEPEKEAASSPRSDRSRSRSKSKARSASRSSSRGSRPMSRGSGRSRSGSARSGSRSRSRSMSRSRSRSRSGSPMSRASRSRSRSRSSSRSRSRSRSVSRSRSRSSSRSRSRSKSPRKDGGGSGDEEEIGKAKKRVVREAFGEDSDSGGGGEKEAKAKPRKRIKRKRINSEGEEEEEEVEVTDDEAVAAGEGTSGTAEASKASVEDSSDDEGPPRAPDHSSAGPQACDFDLMLERKKAEQRRRRRKKDIDLINDNDDAIAKMIADMKLAAREDRDLNSKKQPATKKISMLPIVMSQLNKADLQMAFVEANVLSVLTDWLAPMPDKSLPSVQIRKSLLKLLLTLGIDDHSRLKESGIGKAVMYLYKHPRELRVNKNMAGKIISQWFRPIFNLSTDFKSVSKEERMARDEMLSDQRQQRKDKSEEVDETGLRPGDPGWCYRARVPKVSSSSYVNRPAWTSHEDISRSVKKETTRLEKHMRAAQERKKNSKSRRAIDISIEGRKMAL